MEMLWPSLLEYFIFAVIYQNGVKHTPCWPAKEAAAAEASAASKCKFNAACSGKAYTIPIFGAWMAAGGPGFRVPGSR